MSTMTGKRTRTKRSGALGLPDIVIRVYDESGNVIETHERAGDFKEP